MLACYSPALIGLTLDCSHCRDFWLVIWPVVPGGFLFEWSWRLLRIGRAPGPVSAVMSGVLTIGLILGTVSLSRKGRGSWIAGVVGMLLYATYAYYVAGMVIRM